MGTASTLLCPTGSDQNWSDWGGGRVRGVGESQKMPETQPWGCVSGFRAEESQPTPKTRPHGRVFGVGMEVKAREAGENQKHAPMGVLLVFERCWLGGDG